MALFGLLIKDWFTLAIVVVTIICILFRFCTQQSRRVKRQGPFGTFGSNPTGQKHYAIYLKEIYDKVKTKGWKYGGIYVFTETVFLPIDLGIIEDIVKDFRHFQDRAVLCPNKEPIHPHLLNLKGEAWYKWRTKVRPMFTEINMRTMFDLIAECRNDLRSSIDRECRKNEAINIQEIILSFVTNVIGSCVFGLESVDLVKFRIMGKMLFTPSGFRHHFAATLKEVADSQEIEILIRKNVAKFVRKVVQRNVAYREKNNYRRNDFMQFMIDLKNKPAPIDRADYLEDKFFGPFTLNDFIPQVLVFCASGFEATSALMTFVLYELARHQNIQNKLRHDMKLILDYYRNEINYQTIKTMQYLDQVIEETLRMHPCERILNRICREDYKVPNADVVIEKGTVVNISVLGLHYDAEYFPDPEKFDPERFSVESKVLRGRGAYACLSFGAGDRCCNGWRFGLLQSKIGLATLLQKYHFTVNEKTKEPIGYHPGSTTLIGEEGIWLNAKRI